MIMSDENNVAVRVIVPDMAPIESTTGNEDRKRCCDRANKETMGRDPRPHAFPQGSDGSARLSNDWMPVVADRESSASKETVQAFTTYLTTLLLDPP
jgi:hypothetical protein